MLLLTHTYNLPLTHIQLHLTHIRYFSHTHRPSGRSVAGVGIAEKGVTRDTHASAPHSHVCCSSHTHCPSGRGVAGVGVAEKGVVREKERVRGASLRDKDRGRERDKERERRASPPPFVGPKGVYKEANVIGA